MIKAIIFDCFGVLTADLWKEFCSTLDPEVRVQASDLNHAFDRGMLTHDEFFKQVRELTGRPPELLEQARNGGSSKNGALLQYIAELKQTYKIGLLSNVATSWITDTLLSVEEHALFDSMTFSYQVGVTKPDPRIFGIACERLDVDFKETIFIDDIEAYVSAAKELGMQGVVYEDFAQTKQGIEAILADTNR